MHGKACIVPLVSPSADSLTRLSLQWPGYGSIDRGPAGVIVMGLRPACVEQMPLDLLGTSSSGANGAAVPPRRIQAIKALDALNGRFGRGPRSWRVRGWRSGRGLCVTGRCGSSDVRSGSRPVGLKYSRLQGESCRKKRN